MSAAFPPATLQDWQARAQVLHFEHRAFLENQYCEAQDGKRFDCVSPIDGRVLTQVVECGEAEVERAVRAARRAFEGGGWAELAPRARADILQRFADAIAAHTETLALLETLDAGKPISNTLHSDIPGAVYCLRWFAEAIDKLPGEVAPVDPNLLGLVTREPVGVVAAVVPWNFPLAMAMWKLAPALATGNAVLLKPSEKSPLSALYLGQLAAEAGIPCGILQILPGSGAVGQRLALHPDIDCIAFTGSTATGKKIMQCAAQSNLKRVWLELGGKSANIVLPDCHDLARAAQVAAEGICYNMGQMCTAASRLLVHRDIAEDFSAAVMQAMADWVPGNPLDPRSRIGAIIDRAQMEQVLDYIDSGKQEAQLLLGGRQLAPVPKGYYIEPTLFAAAPVHRIAREEIFGPVLSILPFTDTAEAVRIANDSIYGLGAAVWSADLTTAHEVARQLRAGSVWVNCYEEGGDMNFPFGGYRQSGNGRDRSLHALEKYTELKSTIIKLR